MAENIPQQKFFSRKLSPPSDGPGSWITVARKPRRKGHRPGTSPITEIIGLWGLNICQMATDYQNNSGPKWGKWYKGQGVGIEGMSSMGSGSKPSHPFSSPSGGQGWVFPPQPVLFISLWHFPSNFLKNVFFCSVGMFLGSCSPRTNLVECRLEFCAENWICFFNLRFVILFYWDQETQY